MGDPVWLDTNVLQAALDGDAAVNQQLSDYRKAGRQLLVPQAVENELLYGNPRTMKAGRPFVRQIPKPQLRAAMQKGMIKLGVEVDTRANSIAGEKHIRYRNIKTPNIVTESDRLVLSEIKASAEARGVIRPQMITAEAATKPMMTEASRWGIQSVASAKPAPGTLPKPPRVDLANYPAEKDGPISKYFKDRPVLKQLGLIGANVGAQVLTDAMFKTIQGHFEKVLGEAKKEFESKYPDPNKLSANAQLNRYKQAYQAAYSKITAPTRARVAEYVTLAFTPDRDIDKVKKYLDDKISQVQSAADGSLSGYAKVALEYIDAMVALYKSLSGESLIHLNRL